MPNITCPKGHTFEKSSSCRTCPKCEHIRLKEIFPGLSSPAKRALMNAGYNTWQDLRNCKLETIAGLHGMGPTGIAIIKQQLSGLGISFEE